MSKQREFFKKVHPNQFSDSKIVKVGRLDRDFFSYYLETLTNEGREKDFEVFCRKLAEAVICPNLLPQTGPTGGGDSKVDTETFPVSETLASTWYYGYGNEAATTRWAFAISAKKVWKPKVKSDVNKIVKVNSETRRGYTKVFFMTNQYVSDKKRAETEDELRILHNIDVRILDKSWILDKVFNGNNKEIAIDCFHLSDSFRDELQIGAKDLQKERELEEIENSLKHPSEIKEAKCLALAMRCITLGRELELPKEKMIGILERAQSLSAKYGMNIDRAEAIYQYAWTIFWWYPDSNIYYKKYLDYEKLTLEDTNVHQLNNLTTLWINLFSLDKDEPGLIPIERHTDILVKELQKYINDTSRPNTALEARASYQMVRIMLRESLEDILNEYFNIIKASESNLDLNLYSINKIIMETPVFKKSANYNEVFELLIDKMATQSQDLSTARLLIRRGIEVQDNHPYEAIRYFSRSLRRLFKEESKDDLIIALVNMALSFEKVGLLWAARNFYMYVFYLSFNQYFKFGELNPSLIVSSHALKFLELRMGRVSYATEFHKIENIALHLYPENIESADANDLFDSILGIQMFRVSFSDLTELEYYPDTLSELDLPLSSVALKYELGYYDEEILQEFDGNIEAFNNFILKWYNQPAREQLIGLPWFGFEENVVFNSKVLGCKIKLISPNNVFCMEIGSTILASLESFFVTGMQNNLVPMSKSIILEINYIDSPSFFIKLKQGEEQPNHILIDCSNYSKEDLIDAQKQTQDFLIEILSCIVSILFPYGKAMASIEKMILNENALDRSQTFSNSTFYVLENLGLDMSKLKLINAQNKKYTLLRTEKVLIEDNCINNEIPTQSDKQLQINFGKPPENSNFENTSQQNISINSIINAPLWDKAQWKGVSFLSTRNNDFPPVLSPVFTNKIGNQIFKEWIADYGGNDLNNDIQIGIIKGINKKHPFWYRVIIGSDILNKSKEKFELIQHIQRLHTMQASTDKNLNVFENLLKSWSEFIFVPSLMKNQFSRPEIQQKYAIRKNKLSISICNAHDIKENDYFLSTGIMPDDDPIIPLGMKDPFVLKLIKEKKHFLEKH